MKTKFTYRSLTFIFLIVLTLAGCRNEKNRINDTCFDEVQNQDELRVDCGGPNCPECLPTCDDGIWNGDETGVDCGGENCEPCATCDDGEQNAHWIPDPNLTTANLGQPGIGIDENGTMYRLVMETGINCGYPCIACEPSCNDGIMNNGEYGIDCVKEGGNSDCPTCNPATLCGDGIQDGSETGVDCGDLDGYCPDCDPPSCNDGIQNIHMVENSDDPMGYTVVYEQGIDCVINPNMANISGCSVCPLPTCYDGIKNGGELAIDCGGSCPACDEEATCSNGVQDEGEDGVDCVTGGSDTCPPCPSCNDGIINGPEIAFTEDGESECLDYPVPSDYPYPSYVDNPCAICISCHNGLQDQDEIAVDCGGPNCEPCQAQVIFSSISKPPGDNGSVILDYEFYDQDTYNQLIPSSVTIPDAIVTAHSLTQGLVTITAKQQVDVGEYGIFERVLTITVKPAEVPDDGLAIAELPFINAPGSQVTPTVKYTQRFIPNNSDYTSFEYLSLDVSSTEPSDFSEFIQLNSLNFPPTPSKIYVTEHFPANASSGEGRLEGSIDNVVLKVGGTYVCPNGTCGAPKYVIIENIDFAVNYDF